MADPLPHVDDCQGDFEQALHDVVMALVRLNLTGDFQQATRNAVAAFVRLNHPARVDDSIVDYATARAKHILGKMLEQAERDAEQRAAA